MLRCVYTIAVTSKDICTLYQLIDCYDVECCKTYEIISISCKWEEERASEQRVSKENFDLHDLLTQL